MFVPPLSVISTLPRSSPKSQESQMCIVILPQLSPSLSYLVHKISNVQPHSPSPPLPALTLATSSTASRIGTPPATLQGHHEDADCELPFMMVAMSMVLIFHLQVCLLSRLLPCGASEDCLSLWSMVQVWF